MSFMILTIVENAVLVSGLYIIDKIRPVAICVVRVIPSKNPKFHMKEIDAGLGRSIKDLFSIFTMGFFFLSCFFIKSWSILIV